MVQRRRKKRCQCASRRGLGAIVGTIPLAIVSFAIGLVIALVVALMRLSNVRFVSSIARFFVSVVRGTPPLVQLFVIFSGLPSIGLLIPPWPSAVIAFSLNVGGYASEVIRAAILAVPRGQWEAGQMIGVSHRQTLARIILPQAARVSVPPLSNTFISLVKDTSLASLILVTELFAQAQKVAAFSGEFMLLYLEAALVYWIICRHRCRRCSRVLNADWIAMSSTDPVAPAAPLLRVSGLKKSFGHNEVLKSIDFTLTAGKVLVLIGPSGSGKTTALRCLNGLETPDAGTVSVAGDVTIRFDEPVTKKQRLALRDCSAMVFQNYNLFPHLTVLQNVIERPVRVKKVAKARATEDALRLLAQVGLAEKRDAYPFELSGGQQQRVGIVRVLEFARQVADEVLFLDGEVIVERGDPRVIFTAPREERTQRFLARLLRPLD